MKIVRDEVWRLKLKDKEVSINITKLKEDLQKEKFNLKKYFRRKS